MEATHGSWGERIRTFKWNGGIVTVLRLEPWQRCSYHKHTTAYNQFYVISGELGVLTEKGYTTHLKPGQAFTVEPGLYHEFQTYYEPTVVEEIAYVKYNEHDIQRKKLGGPLEHGNKTEDNK